MEITPCWFLNEDVLAVGLRLTWSDTEAEERCQDENEWDVYHPEQKDGLGAKKWTTVVCEVWQGFFWARTPQSWHKMMQYFPEPEIPHLFSEGNPWLISASLLTYIMGTCLRFLFIIIVFLFFFLILLFQFKKCKKKKSKTLYKTFTSSY